MQSVQVARCHMLLISDPMKADHTAGNDRRESVFFCSMRQSLLCILLLMLKICFFFPYNIVCKAKSFELFTSEITFPDKRAK